MATVHHDTTGVLRIGEFKRKRILICLMQIAVIGLFQPWIGTAADTGPETVIVAVKVNEVEKGEYILKMTSQKDFLIGMDDLKKMGLTNLQGKLADIDGKACMSLKSISGITYHFDESEASLRLTAEPQLLPETVIRFEQPRHANIYYPRDNSLFFNYGIGYQTGADLSLETLSVSQQVGVRFRDVLFLSDSIYTDTRVERHFTRLMSNFTHEDRSSLNRTVVGDFYATSGTLGSSVQLGGVSYSKNYAMDPYYIKQPGFDYSGYAKLPSEISIYLDGLRVKTEKISPGRFDLKNLLTSAGFHDLEITVKDVFGREQVVTHPFYFTSALLKKGLHEYSYNIGFLREDYGAESDRYGKPVFTAYHRYGLSRSATVGFQAEGMRGLLNGGGQMSYRLGNWGTLDGSVAVSTGDQENSGLAGTLNHTYMGNRISTRLYFAGFTKHYETINRRNSAGVSLERTQHEIGAGLGYGNKRLGSLSFDLAHVNPYGAESRQTYGVSYSRSLTRNLSFTASCRYVSQTVTDRQFFMSLTYYPGRNITASLSYQSDRDGRSELLQVQKNPPLGEGFSYRASFQEGRTNGSPKTVVNPYLRYNGPYGVYTSEYWGLYEKDKEKTESCHFSASGSIVYVGGRFGLSRPVDDSFAIVEVGKIPGVLAYYNNQELGRTDKNGTIVIPNLGAYVENDIAINDKDIPVNYNLASVNRYVSPPLRSGTHIKFEANRLQAFTGFLKIKVGNAEKPLEYHEIALKIPGRDVTFPTGRDGEFYFENMAPGTYAGEFFYGQKVRTFSLTIPESDAIVVELGDIHVDIEDENQ